MNLNFLVEGKANNNYTMYHQASLSFFPRGKKGGISCLGKAQGPPLGGPHVLLLLLLVLRVYLTTLLVFWHKLCTLEL
jgi:hypothetical protein